jgi:hypothetical protein
MENRISCENSMLLNQMITNCDNNTSCQAVDNPETGCYFTTNAESEYVVRQEYDTYSKNIWVHQY